VLVVDALHKFKPVAAWLANRPLEEALEQTLEVHGMILNAIEAAMPRGRPSCQATISGAPTAQCSPKQTAASSEPLRSTANSKSNAGEEALQAEAETA